MPVKLHYNITGEGRPVIILHGLFGSSRNWRSLAGKIGRTHRVITIDLRNHGQSGRSPSMTYLEMAGDILSFIVDHALDNVVLMGHSMGGKVAMVCTLLQPLLIAKLLVLDIAPVSYAHRYGKLFYALQNLPLHEIKNRNQAEQKLNELINDPRLSRFLIQNLIKSKTGYQWRLDISTIRNNIKQIGSFPELDSGMRYDRPALFMGGAESHFLQPVHHHAIRKYFPGANIELLEKAGHLLHFEQPLKVLDRITLFLQE
jgi:Predicted hydrolases or acyltransferases (alpha/beta hydrolase superfamily)